ncbi:hypothetical protein [Teredinibacter sp. KSP-S5-2]|uniref:hypothetical protein n=1 Tax=Teredinibacter sp. KSP-S5-2 TaxID=3034506 RepID=UPI002934C513|nr:hypothetical protein [Teredinibacter sp. KSP-S5-2]WNO11121.1 hypothetical protein P5V12_08045 [Teredinibacter sp. KSP-S5-2]
MNSIVKFASIGYVVLVLVGCKSDSMDSCVEGDYYPQYVVTSLKADVHAENTLWRDGDVAFDPKLLVIELNGNKEVVITQNSKIESKLEFSLFPKAYACSSVLPYSNQVVTGFSITSNTDYSAQFLAGNELAGVFKVDFSYYK